MSSEILYVSITELKRSDSGKYRCRSDTWTGSLHDDFDLIVTASTAKPQNPSSSPSLSSSETSKYSGLLLYVVLTLIAKIILLSTPLVIFFWKKRFTKNKDPAVRTEYADVFQANP
ncbi:uncharacterized protein V3H82_011040 [Fundulus diaphanus]